MESIQRIYTDGACLGNGKNGAKAGYGVYFGPRDSRNISSPMNDCYIRTNQRAELKGILEGIRASDPSKLLTIVTDSKYAIKVSTIWGDKWESQGYYTAFGNPVLNQDLIRDIRNEINHRNGRVLFEYAKGHGDDIGNIIADRMAQKGASLDSGYQINDE